MDPSNTQQTPTGGKMKQEMKFTLAALALTTAFACASKEKTEEANAKPAPGPSMEAKQVANEQEAAFVTEITFKKGSNSLTQVSKQKLTHLLANAKSAGDVEEIKVISWADTEYPSVNTKKLSKKERDLARNRNSEIQKYLKAENDRMKFTAYNMAERPNVFQDWLNTSDARIKKSLEVAGIPTTDTSVKIPSKASRSMVMALLKK